MKILKATLICVMVIALASSCFAEIQTRSGKILEMKGKVNVAQIGGETVPAKVGMALHEGDILETKGDAWALIELEGIEKSTVEIDQNSQLLLSKLELDTEEGSQNTMLDVAIGKILIKVAKLRHEKSKFEVKTPTSVVGVRGTEFAVEVEALD